MAAQLTLLALSRAREYGADRWACQVTGDGDRLAWALVKIGYGMGQADMKERERLRTLRASGDLADRQRADRRERQLGHVRAAAALGISEPRAARSMAKAYGDGLEPARVTAAMRWDATNPWGRVLELLSSHPLPGRRIAALQRRGVQGAPRGWHELRALSGAGADEIAKARSRFAGELGILLAPSLVIIALVLGWIARSPLPVGAALIIAGSLLLALWRIRYPNPAHFSPSGELAGLLDRLDAGPMAGLPVEARGRLIGRGAPGSTLTDLALEDASVFVPLRSLSLRRARTVVGREVTARGWYRRTPNPVIDLRELVAADGQPVRTWYWRVPLVVSWLLLAAGAAVLLISLGTGA